MYQVTNWTVVIVKDEAAENAPFSGRNLRVFELQRNGAWKVEAHIFVGD